VDSPVDEVAYVGSFHGVSGYIKAGFVVLDSVEVEVEGGKTASETVD